jgi:hypothetical protein
MPAWPQAARIGRACSDFFQGAPLDWRNINWLLGRPAQCCFKKAAPSSVNTTWRGLPDLDLRIASVPASGLKSATSSRVSSP